MTRCPTREQLQRLLDERLNGPEKEAVEAHVEGCAACQQVLEDAAADTEADQLRPLRGASGPGRWKNTEEFLSRVGKAALSAARPEGATDNLGASIDDPAGHELPPDAPTRQAGPGDAMTTEAPPLGPGTVLGQYRILERLGAGGMGQVYKAVHQAMDRVVALKVIAPHLVSDTRAVARFQQEVRHAARLAHPNIVMAHDAAEAGGLWFLVMEYVEGTTLSELVRRQGLPPVPVACEILRQAALGLQHAHEQGMVHRDIKPSNLMVAANGPAHREPPGDSPADRPAAPMPGWPAAPTVKVLDFGVARLQAPTGSGPVPAPGLTQEGCVVGTPEFMAPEQATDSRSVDIRSDIYSLGCTFYYLLTGVPPFVAKTALETMVQHLRRPPEPVDQRRPGLPPGVAAIVHKMLAKKPEDRYQTPAEVANTLLPWTGSFAPPVTVEPAAPSPALDAVTPRPLPQPAAAPAPPQSRPACPLPPPAEGGFGRGCVTFATLFLVTALAFAVGWIFIQPRGPKVEDIPPPPQTLRTLGSMDMKVAVVPAGQFQRSGRSGAYTLTFRRGLEVGTTEVTVGQFGRFVDAAQYRSVAETSPRPGAEVPDGKGGLRWDPEACWDHCGVEKDASLPVMCVAWEDALAFCNWLSQQEKLPPCYSRRGNGWVCDFTAGGFRLPTSAEWERFARLEPSQQSGPGGGLIDFGWFRDNSGGRPHPVGQKKPGPHHLQDAWGNVWEWCWDWYEADVPERSADDPTGPASGKQRTVRGGSWNEESAAMSGGGARRGLPADHRSATVGFRVVRTIGGK